jgi:sRNA-binding protein
MPCTCSTNADVHPRWAVLSIQQCRHNQKQIEEDNARAKAEAYATKKRAKAQHQAAIEQIVAIKDSIEEEEQEVQRYTTRPDLRPKVKTPSGLDSKTLSENDCETG